MMTLLTQFHILFRLCNSSQQQNVLLMKVKMDLPVSYKITDTYTQT